MPVKKPSDPLSILKYNLEQIHNIENGGTYGLPSKDPHKNRAALRRGPGEGMTLRYSAEQRQNDEYWRCANDIGLLLERANISDDIKTIDALKQEILDSLDVLKKLEVIVTETERAKGISIVKNLCAAIGINMNAPDHEADHISAKARME